MVRLAIEKLVEEWRSAYARWPEHVVAALRAVAFNNRAALATHFYDEMLQDPVVAPYLTHEQVKVRLHAAMENWIRSLFVSPPADLHTSILTQQKIGDVHSRVGVPMHVVLRGSRAMKSHLYELIRQNPGLTSAGILDAQTMADTLFSIALEAMGSGYAAAHDRRSRAEGSYRLFSVIQNVEAEKERQRAALFNWENRLLYELASGAVAQSLPRLASSEFGLWFRHKGAHAFQGSAETDHIVKAMQAIDTGLEKLGCTATRADHELVRAELFRLMREKSSEIRYNLDRLFDQSSTLESGRDALTRMLSRKFLPVVMHKELEYARETETRFAMLMADIDHFKQVNDTYGHNVGDQVLQHFATLLNSISRAGDYVFRTGGEEFMVLLVDITPEAAQRVAESLRERVEGEPFRLNDETRLELTVSIGLALYDGHPDYEQTLQRADRALYQAKNGGRNRVVMLTD